MLSYIQSQLLSMPLYNQDVLIKKLNQYVKSNSKENILQDSYCHGLTLLWLYMAIEGDIEENKFHQMIKKIIDSEISELNKDRKNIDKFIAHIEWLQNPGLYLEGTRQIDIETSLECRVDYQLSFQYNKDQLDGALSKLILENKMICICSEGHTVGVIARDGNYFFYDCNHIFGGSIKTDSISDLKELFINALSNPDKPSEHISFTIIACTKQYQKMRLRQRCPIDRDSLIKEAKNITNSLFIASLDGDDAMVKKLLKNGADINKRNPHEDNMSALGVAVLENRMEIIHILLQNNANINLSFSNDETALHYAVKYAYSDIVLHLLKYGANPLQKTKKGDTALLIAIRNLDWVTSAIVFSYINDISNLSRNEIRYIRDHNNEIILALYDLEKTLPKLIFLKTLDMFREICRGKWENSLFNKNKIIHTEETIPKKSLKVIK